LKGGRGGSRDQGLKDVKAGRAGPFRPQASKRLLGRLAEVIDLRGRL
jgi:hypothetical protein